MLRRKWLLIPLVILIFGILYIAGQLQHTDRKMRGELLLQSELVSHAVESKFVKSLTGTCDDLENPDYFRLKEQFTAIRSINPKYRFIYLLGRNADGSVFFFVDNEPDDSEDISLPGMIYKEASEQLSAVFDTKKAFVEGPVQDEWGVWVSSLMPIIDPVTDQVVAVLGVDVAANDWKLAVISKAGLPIALVLLLLFSIYIVLTVLRMSQNIRTSRRELIISKSRFDELAEQSCSIAWEVDTEGLYTYISHVAEQILGYTREEIVGKMYFYDLHPENGREIFKDKAFELFSRQETFKNIENQVMTKDGRIIWYSTNGLPILDERGNLLGYRGCDTDISERKELEQKQEIQMEFQKIATLASARFINASQKDFDISVENTLRDLSRLFGIDRGYMFLFSDDLSTMSVTHQWFAPGIPSLINCQDLLVSSLSWWKNQMEQVRPVHIPDVNELPESAVGEKKEWLLQGIKSLICLPMQNSYGKLIGFIGFDTVRQKYCWPEDQISKLQLLAEIIGGAIERNRAAEQVIESELRLDKVINAAQDAIIMLDPNGNISMWNDSAERIFGYSTEEIMGLDLHQILAPKRFHEGFKNGFSHFGMTGDGNAIGKIVEIFAIRKNGEEFPVELSLSSVQIKGEWHAIGILRDITSRKQAEEGLQLTQFVVDKAHDGILWIDQDANIHYVNDAVCSQLGYAKEELLQMSVFDVDPKFDPEKWPEHWTEIFKKGHFLLETEHKRKDGSIVPVEISVNALVSKDKRYNVVFVRDITERKQAEQQLQKLAKRLEREHDNLQHIFNASITGMLLIDEKTSIVRVNPGILQLVGKDGDELLGQQPGNAMCCIHALSVEQGCGYAEPCQDCPLRNTAKDVFASGEPVYNKELEQTLILEGKEQRLWISLSATPVEIDNKRHLLLSLLDITERKNAENELRESKEQFELALAGSNDGIWDWDIRTNKLFLSSRWKKMLGYEEEELKNEFSTFESLVFEEDRARVIENVKDYLSGKLSHYEIEFRMKHKDDSLRWILAKGAELRDDKGVPYRMAGSHSDITERKQTEIALKAKSEELERYFTSSLDLLCIADTSGHFIRLNPQWEETLGYSVHELMGRSFLDFVHPEDLDSTIEIVSLLKDQQEIFSFENRYRCKDNSYRWIEWRSHPQGDIIYAAARDITDRKNSEIKLKESQVKLEQSLKESEKLNNYLQEQTAYANHMTSVAESANSAKSEFLANMSHEIRTPMNAIIGFSEMLSDTELTTEQVRSVTFIQESGKALLHLINDILDFSKIEAGKLELDITECSLGKLLNAIESMMTFSASSKNLEFKIIEENGLPALIKTDQIRLKQCLINLINNAIKFTDDGYVRLKVSLEQIDQEYFIRFDIQDTGIGIAKDKQQKIFESFSQADGSTTRKYGGTGLGLSITKQLAELLGGIITLQSKLDEGSTFSLSIPAGLDITNQNLMDRHDIASHIMCDHEQKNRPNAFIGNALVAEDVVTNQILIRSMLEKQGLSVDVVTNGKDAFEKILESSYDIVFMDIQMPILDGLKATRAIRKKGIKIPVIALTANAMQGDDKKCLKAGCDEYMSKPIKSDILVQMLKKYICNKPAIDEIDTKSESNCSIDYNSLINQGLDRSLIDEIISVFVVECVEKLDSLNNALNCQDSLVAAELAHCIKGAAASSAANEIRALAMDIEKSVGQGNFIKAKNLANQIEFQLMQIKDYHENGLLKKT